MLTIQRKGILTVDPGSAPNQKSKAKIYRVPAINAGGLEKTIANAVITEAFMAITNLFDVEHLKESTR